MTTTTIKTPFLITSRNYEIQNPEKLQSTLTKSYEDIAAAVNLRQIGVYDESQTNTGQRWFENSNLNGRLQAFRKIFRLSSVVSGDNRIPHGLQVNSRTIFTHIYGVLNQNGTDAYPIPYLDVPGGDNVGLWVDATDIHIVTTTANWTAFNALVVLEYILDG